MRTESLEPEEEVTPSEEEDQAVEEDEDIGQQDVDHDATIAINMVISVETVRDRANTMGNWQLTRTMNTLTPKRL